MFIPKDRYDTTVRRRIGAFLAEVYGGRVSAAYPSYPEGLLARTQFIIGRDEGRTPQIDQETLERGIAAIALSDGSIEGIRGTINISGGDGGDPSHVDAPCRPDRMAATLAAYGVSNRLPTLWMYSANDRLWGPDLPHQWFDAFRSRGGRGQFIQLPADKNNGHYIFNRNAQAWHPPFEAFVRHLGLPAP